MISEGLSDAQASSSPYRYLSMRLFPVGIRPLVADYKLNRVRQSCRKSSTLPLWASGLGSARSVEAAAGPPRDLCAFYAQIEHQPVHGRSARRSDPQPRWHPA